MHSATGANCTPLGRPSYLKTSGFDAMEPNPPRISKFKRSLDEDDSRSSTGSDKSERRKKRKSRWGGDENDKVIIPGMPTMLPGNMTENQQKIYLLQLQIEDVSKRLRTGDLGIPMNPEERSPSPEPIYNNEGKRLNTREFRTRKRLEDQRHDLVQQMSAINMAYKPPPDYKPPQQKISEKVLIPQEEYPDINFVGLLIGPRGNTLKSMEKDTGAKIIIRGKGSVKEGKIGRKDGQPMPGEDEPLHAFITAPSTDAVLKAVDRIKDVIRQGIEVPENQNALRRMQLRELALLNGTLRESDGPRCSNCGSSAHRSWQCPDKPNVTNNVVCTNCGATGHISKDCKEKKTVGSLNASKIDEEYMSLMAELGEGPPPPPKPRPVVGASDSSVSPSLLAPPPPPPPASSGGLLPTPSGSGSNNAYFTQQSYEQHHHSQQQQQQQSYSWNQIGYGYGGGHGESDSYSNMYSQNNQGHSGWMQQGMWGQAPPPPPPPVAPPSSSGGSNNWGQYMTMPPPPPPPPPS